MPAEGMVHALELVYGLLSPGGQLIDIHPSGKPYVVEIKLHGVIHQLGELLEVDEYIEYFQADQALQQAIHSGLFVLARQEKFTYLDKADSLEELRSYLLGNWSDLIWPDEISQLANTLTHPGDAGGIPAALREDVVIRTFHRSN